MAVPLSLTPREPPRHALGFLPEETKAKVNVSGKPKDQRELAHFWLGEETKAKANLNIKNDGYSLSV